MAYYLGIDLGTTYTAAAIERDGLVESLTLGNRTASVPSVVFLRDDGEILVGEAATRRATSEPGRVGREFKRRVGDPTPIILGGTPYAAEMLMARLLRWSLDRVQEQQGAPPEALALTHPANWGPYKLDLLRQAVRQVDVAVALTLPEPVAAATFYASQRRLEPGAVVAVYDLGGGTFDAAMVRRKTEGFELIGTPEGIERLGGIDFDEAVFAHVREALGDALDKLDVDEPASVAAVARLRQECIDAKEALSSDTDVSIPVLLPHLQTEVRLTRREFEDMIRPAIGETIVALRRSIRSANVGNDEISAVLLVGGSSRIPLVAQMVTAELARPIAIDAHPKDAISFGAAIAVAQHKGGKATPESVTTVLPDDRRPPPPTMSHGTTRPAPPVTAPQTRPAPPTGRVVPPGADPRPAPPVTAPQTRPAPPSGPPGQQASPAAAAAAAAAAARAAQTRPQQAPQTSNGPANTQAAAANRQGPSTAATGNYRQPPQAGAPAAGAAGATGATAYRPSQQPGQVQMPAVQQPQARPVQGQPQGRMVPPGGSPVDGMPAVRYGTQAQPARNPYAAGGGQSGGYGPQQGVQSGGYGAMNQGGGYGTGENNRMPLLIAIAVLAGILIIVLIVLIGKSGDEGAGSGDAPDGYSQAVRDEFVGSCTQTPNATEAECECVYQEISANVPFDDFLEFDTALGENRDAEQPGWFREAISAC
jgi:actin-like ATPase involved in cell morphogenesis